MVAQTVTYGLFTAAEQQGDKLSYEHLAESVPNTNPFLRDLLLSLTTDGGLDLAELGIDQLVEMLRSADVVSIAQQFMRRTNDGREDPVIHFYEQFLAQYDRQQKVERGVFYTPDPVVSYMVRAVDHLLQTEFGIVGGFASTETTPDGQPRVQVLDPATGTGTFLAHIIDSVHKQWGGKPGWNDYVANHLLPRLNGFELMMAPYTVAHMKLALKLQQTGYDAKRYPDARLRVFLTNALERPEALEETLLKTDYLAKESNAAAAVKRSKPIMVVIGNPPYSGHSANEIQQDWFGLADYYTLDGQPLNERNSKWLQDDYVKFMRFGQWRIEQNGEGILAFITNHGYLDSPTFRGMRQQLMRAFDDIYLIDLHGNARKRETAPDGGKDENVFDIMQGVAIGIFVKRRRPDGEAKPPARVFHRSLWGLREGKYDELNSSKFLTEVREVEITPQNPSYVFSPQDSNITSEHQKGWRLVDALKAGSIGIVTARDELVLQWDSDLIWNILLDFSTIPAEEARIKYSLGPDARDWQVRLAQSDIQNTKTDRSLIVPFLYRPFDYRYTYYTGQTRGFMCMPRSEVMDNLANKNNLALITTRQTRDLWSVSVTKFIAGHKSMSAYDSNTISPLYLYPTTGELLTPAEWPLSDKGRRPNLSKAFVDDVAGRLGLTFLTDGRGDLATTFGPEDVFHYAYAIFHAPSYRTRYAEQLKIDFPRLPLTNDLALFRDLCGYGARLVGLHLLESGYAGQALPLSPTDVRFVPVGGGVTVGTMHKANSYREGRVYLDTARNGSYFEGVPEAVWNFQIGGYQVCHKWLADRKNRTLSEDDIQHYIRVVAALRETIHVMGEIDARIGAAGGFPLPGQVAVPESPVPTDESPQESTMPETDQEQLDDPNPPEITGEARTLEDYAIRSEGTEPEPPDPNQDGTRIITPFDPTKIHMDARQMSLDILIRRIRDGRIDLQPDFQRAEGVWDDVRQSKLIESILIRIPLPAFYIDATNDDQWLIVDGLQRLSTLKKFVVDKKLPLKGLEYLREYEGKGFDQLPLGLQRRIEETQATVIQIQRGTPPEIKYDIFRRINTLGLPLSAQEIRNALNQGKSTRLLKKLAGLASFKQATDNSIDPKRMADQELVLRYLAFTLTPPEAYTSNDLDQFLNNTMRLLNNMPDAELEALTARFDRAMQNAYALFGNRAFRKVFRDSGRRGTVSKALFEVWTVNLDALSDAEIAKLRRRRKRLSDNFLNLLDDPEFNKAITYSTAIPERVQLRFAEVGRIIEETLSDD